MQSSHPRKSNAARIVGLGALAGTGRGITALWKGLSVARPLQAEHDLGDPRLSGSRHVAIPEPRDPDGDLAAKWLRLACEDALSAAGPVLGRLQSPRVALLCGSSLGGMSLHEARHRRWWGGSSECGPGLQVGAAPVWRALYDGPATAVGEQLGLTAGAWTLNTACSSAANALGLARRWLLRRRIDVALVAGVDVISPFVLAGFQGLSAVDPEPTTPFGAGRRGLNLGEAAVALVLTRAEAAPNADGTVVDLVGYGSSCDAHHLTRPDPGGAGLARAIQRALADAGVRPDQVELLSAHGTGTAFNDAMEAAAFASVFGKAVPPLHCAKPVTGHTLGAAGAIDALAVVLMLQHALLPPTFLRGEEDPALGCHPSRRELPIDPRGVALSTSSGFGGSNAALVMRRAAP